VTSSLFPVETLPDISQMVLLARPLGKRAGSRSKWVLSLRLFSRLDSFWVAEAVGAAGCVWWCR